MLKKVYYSIAIWLAIFIVIILLFCLFTSILFKTDINSNGLSFFIFIILGILVPGYALLLAIKIDNLNELEIVAYSLFFGYLITFICYFIVVPVKMQIYAPIVFVIVAVVSVMYIINCLCKKRAIEVRTKDISGRWVCTFFIVIMLCVSIFTYAGNNLLPPAIPNNILFNDVMYWTGNTVELMKEYPPLDFRNYPQRYNYHYFTSVQLAYTSLVTGIRPVLMSFAYQFIIPVLMIVLAGYNLFSRYTSKVFIKCFALFVLIFTTGFEKYTIVTYAPHMFVGPFGFDYGMGMFLFVLYLIDIVVKERHITIKYFVILLVFFALLCGIKANFGVAALEIIGLYCIFWVLKDKNWKKAFIIGIPVLLCFIFIYFSVTNVNGYMGSIENEFSKSHVYVDANNFINAHINNHLNEVPLTRILLKVFLLIIYFLIYNIACQPIIYCLIIYIIINFLVKRSIPNRESLIFLATIITCSCINIFIGMAGTSQMYFMMTTYPLGIIFILNNIKFEILPIKMVQMICVLVLLLMGSYCYLNMGYKYSILEKMKNGTLNYLNLHANYDNDNRAYVSSKQVEAFEWVRNNSDEKDLIVINNEWLTPGVFTERYICNKDDTELFFSTNDKDEQIAAVDSMKNRGIKYIIAIKCYLLDDFKPVTYINENVFDNDEVSIYDIN